MTLKWDPPANAGYPGDVTKYQVRFWDKERSCFNEKTVNGSTTTTVITRESGLRPLTETTFEVRACSGDSVSQKWRNATTFVDIDIAMENSGMTAGWRTNPEIQKMVNCSTKDNRITGDDLWVST